MMQQAVPLSLALSFGENMEYILLIHKNADHPPTEDQWDKFFAAANESGMFTGGSAISTGVRLGTKNVVLATESVVGYMRFETVDINQLYELLELHPVKIQGGTLELCETPKT